MRLIMTWLTYCQGHPYCQEHAPQTAMKLATTHLLSGASPQTAHLLSGASPQTGHNSQLTYCQGHSHKLDTPHWLSVTSPQAGHNSLMSGASPQTGHNSIVRGIPTSWTQLTYCQEYPHKLATTHCQGHPHKLGTTHLLSGASPQAAMKLEEPRKRKSFR